VEPTPRARGHRPTDPRTERACALLWGGAPHEILARIVPDDPLGLRALVAGRLSERAFLCDAERVLLIAQAHCALQSSSWRGVPELPTWLEERVEDALASVLSEEGSAAEGGLAESLGLFAEPLGLGAVDLAQACARFNRLPFEQREAFFALVLESAGADRLARTRGLSLSELARRARAGLLPFRRGTPAVPATLAPASAS
jgi:hypothetical protein